MITRKVGFLLFDGMTALDLTGPLEAFHTVGDVCDTRHYECVFIGQNRQTYRTESGLMMTATMSFNDIDSLDTLIIPGGAGSRREENQRHIGPWLVAVKPLTRRMVSICTGAFLLADSGLLDGRKATTHWAFADGLRQHYSRITVIPDALYVDNGDIATSAGISSGVDLALKLIDDDLGARVAADVARFLVVHLRRDGDQAQFSAPLQYQLKTDSVFAGLTGWLLENLQSSMTIGQLAAHCGMSERNFCRRFTEKTGMSPGRYVEQLRLDYARQLLVESTWSLSQISEACGYNSADVFRRAFERRFNLTPKDYRARFSH